MGPGATDTELVRGSLRGDRHARQLAFSALVARYEGIIRAMLGSLCANRALADDLAQESFLTAWERLASLNDTARFGPWLKQIAYRKFLHQVRRREPETTIDVDREPATGLPETADLERVLAICNAAERELLVLVYGFGFTTREVAEARDVPEGTIKSALSRSKERIRQQLEMTTHET